MAIYRGPTVVMLSAIDGPPGPSMAAMHGPGRPSMATTLGPGTDCRGTIGSVTVHPRTPYPPLITEAFRLVTYVQLF